MKIKSIKLLHFRRFTDLLLDLSFGSKKIVALVGPNGSGKSCVFDAFLEKLRDYQDMGGAGNDYLSKSIYQASQEDTGFDRGRSIQIFRENNSQVFDRKSFYVRTPYRFTSSINVNKIQKSPEITEEQRPINTISLDSRLQKNYERLHGQLINEYQNGDKTGKEFKDDLIGEINRILNSILEIKISDLGDIIGGRGQLFFEKGESKNFPFENLSSGEKEVVDLVIDFVMKTKEYNDTIFCIDEPELHLNTSIQRKLFLEIEKLIPENCQLWIATHSIGFLRALQDELRDKSIVLDFSDKNFDEPVIIKPMEFSRKNWKRVFRTALEDLTGLMSPETIVYCEGRKDPGENGEERGLDAEVYNNIFEKEFPKTLFISSGGRTEPDIYSEIALKILGKAFEGVELLILKDMDINGDKSPTTTEQRNEWLARSNSHRMLNRKEIENYLFDFEILSKKYTNLKEDKYNEIVENIVNDDVKDKVSEIMNLCGVITGINKDDFKRGLSKYLTPDTNTYKELKNTIF